MSDPTAVILRLTGDGSVTTERRLSLAEARHVLALAEALPRSPDAVAPLLCSYCRER